MSKTTTPKPADKKAEELKETPEEKICFVVMPISDQEGYEKGHFKRVYEHLIKPAVIKAGLKPVRADDEYKTNNIVLDIIRKIIESEHVICDLSAKNANVFYELGMRQAFDKSITLIKDNKTPRVFDVSGIRTIDYDESLRIDTVQNKIEEIATSIQQTLAHKDSDSIENSVIKQLAIKAAKPAETTEISSDTQLILERLTQLELTNKKQYKRTSINDIEPIQKIKYSFKDEAFKTSGITIRNEPFNVGDILLRGSTRIGEIYDILGSEIIIKNEIGDAINISSIPIQLINDDFSFHTLKL